MTDVTDDVTFEITAGIGHTFKEVKAHIAESVGADDGDTFTFDISKAGATELIGVEGWIASTEGSIIVEEDPTTAVSTTTATITIGGSTDDKARFYILHLK